MIFDPPINPHAVRKEHNWLVINTEKNRLVESHVTQGAASLACHALNSHEERCGREPVFKVVERSE